MPDNTYTHGHHASVLRSHTWRTAENSAGYLLPHLRAGLDVLDVGCGPGTITADLARRVVPGRVLGIDRSDAIVAQAADEARDVANASFATQDLETFAEAFHRWAEAPDGWFVLLHGEVLARP